MDTQHFITIFTIVFASSGFWAFLTSWFDRHHRKRTKLEDAMMCVLHDRVYFLCRQHIGKESITHDDYENILKLYTAYSELGGNGTAQKLMNEVEKIPVREE